MKETLFIKKIITLKLVFYEILSFKPKNLTSGNLTSTILGISFNPLWRNSDYPLLPNNDYPLLRNNDYPLLRNNDYPLLRNSDYPLLRNSDYLARAS